VVLSRLFAPVRGVFDIAYVVDCDGRVDVLTRTSPRGDVHCQPAELRRAVKDGPNGPSAASREAASLTARNSGATRGRLRPGQGSEMGRNYKHARKREVRPVPAAGRAV
jgi:hypothetical protein